MKCMDFSKIDISELDSKARVLFEISDQESLKDLFGECETIDEINSVGEDLFDAIYG